MDINLFDKEDELIDPLFHKFLQWSSLIYQIQPYKVKEKIEAIDKLREKYKYSYINSKKGIVDFLDKLNHSLISLLNDEQLIEIFNKQLKDLSKLNEEEYEKIDDYNELIKKCKELYDKLEQDKKEEFLYMNISKDILKHFGLYKNKKDKHINKLIDERLKKYDLIKSKIIKIQSQTQPEQQIIKQKELNLADINKFTEFDNMIKKINNDLPDADLDRLFLNKNLNANQRNRLRLFRENMNSIKDIRLRITKENMPDFLGIIEEKTKEMKKNYPYFSKLLIEKDKQEQARQGIQDLNIEDNNDIVISKKEDKPIKIKEDKPIKEDKKQSLPFEEFYVDKKPVKKPLVFTNEEINKYFKKSNKRDFYKEASTRNKGWKLFKKDEKGDIQDYTYYLDEFKRYEEGNKGKEILKMEVIQTPSNLSSELNQTLNPSLSSSYTTTTSSTNSSSNNSSSNKDEDMKSAVSSLGSDSDSDENMSGSGILGAIVKGIGSLFGLGSNALNDDVIKTINKMVEDKKIDNKGVDTIILYELTHYHKNIPQNKYVEIIKEFDKKNRPKLFFIRNKFKKYNDKMLGGFPIGLIASLIPSAIDGVASIINAIKGKNSSCFNKQKVNKLKGGKSMTLEELETIKSQIKK